MIKDETCKLIIKLKIEYYAFNWSLRADRGKSGFGPGTVSANGVYRYAKWCSPLWDLYGRVSVRTPDHIAIEYGIEQTLGDTELRHRGLIFDVDNLGAVENLFKRNQVRFNRHNDRLIVPSHSECGAFFGFEDV